MFKSNPMSQCMCCCITLDEFWRFTQYFEHWHNISICDARHCCLRSYCTTRCYPRLDLCLSSMAFKHCSEKHVCSLLTHLYVWCLLTIPRPDVQRLLIAYTVDLISVLRELFDLTLKPGLALKTDWQELKEAFETYEKSASRQHNHDIISLRSPQSQQILSANSIHEKVRELVAR